MSLVAWVKRPLGLAILTLILAAAGCTDEEDTTTADAGATSADAGNDSSGATSADASDTSGATNGDASSDTSGSTSADTSGAVTDIEEPDSNVPVDTVTNLDVPPSDTDDADTDDADTDNTDTDDADTVDDVDDADTTVDTGENTGADVDLDVDDGDVPPPTPTYTNDVKAIYQANCSTCHTRTTGCSGGACFGSLYSETQKASNVCPGLTVGECTLERTTNGSMPAMSATDRQTLQEWINAGMPE